MKEQGIVSSSTRIIVDGHLIDVSISPDGVVVAVEGYYAFKSWDYIGSPEYEKNHPPHLRPNGYRSIAERGIVATSTETPPPYHPGDEWEIIDGQLYGPDEDRP